MQWVENFDSQNDGVKSAVLAFLKTNLKIDDDDTILNMNLQDIDSSVRTKLSNLGEVSSQEVKDMIANGNGTIQDLIDIMANSFN